MLSYRAIYIADNEKIQLQTEHVIFDEKNQTFFPSSVQFDLKI